MGVVTHSGDEFPPSRLVRAGRLGRRGRILLPGGGDAQWSPLSLDPAIPWWTDQAGLKSSVGRDLEESSAQYFSDSTAINPSGDFTVWGWFKAESLPPSGWTIIAEWTVAGNQRSWRLGGAGADAYFEVSQDGTASASSYALATDSGAVGTGSFQFFCARYNSSTGGLTLNVDARTAVTATISDGGGAAHTSTGPIEIGDSGAANFADGVVARIGYAASRLSDAQVTSLRNSGTPLGYSDLPSGITAARFWPLDEAAGTAYEVVTGHDLAATNAPVGAIGALTATTATASDTIGGPAADSWTGQGSGAEELTQSTLAACPTLRTTGLYYDGSDDRLEYSGTILTGSDGAVYVIANPTSLIQGAVWSQSQAGSTANWLDVQLDQATGDQAVSNTDAGSYSSVRGTDTTVTAGVESIAGWASSGSDYALYLDSATEQGKAVSAGSDDGNWAADIASMNTTIVGCLRRTAYQFFFHGTIRELVLSNAVLSAGDHDSLWSWLEAR